MQTHPNPAQNRSTPSFLSPLTTLTRIVTKRSILKRKHSSAVKLNAQNKQKMSKKDGAKASEGSDPAKRQGSTKDLVNLLLSLKSRNSTANSMVNTLYRVSDPIFASARAVCSKATKLKTLLKRPNCLDHDLQYTHIIDDKLFAQTLIECQATGTRVAQKRDAADHTREKSMDREELPNEQQPQDHHIQICKKDSQKVASGGCYDVFSLKDEDSRKASSDDELDAYNLDIEQDGKSQKSGMLFEKEGLLLQSPRIGSRRLSWTSRQSNRHLFSSLPSPQPQSRHSRVDNLDELELCSVACSSHSRVPQSSYNGDFSGIMRGDGHLLNVFFPSGH